MASFWLVSPHDNVDNTLESGRRESVLRLTENTISGQLGTEVTVDVSGFGWSGMPGAAHLGERQLGTWRADVGLPEADTIAHGVPQLRLPVLGSPPEEWKTFSTLSGAPHLRHISSLWRRGLGGSADTRSALRVNWRHNLVR